MANDSRRVLLISLACVLPFAIVNFVIATLASQVDLDAPEGVFAFLCMGAIGAEAALHAIWCVLAPVRFAKRLVIGVSVGLGLYGAWALGFAAALAGHSYYYNYFWDDVLTGLLCLPLLAIAVQSPLWLARIWLRWRIEHRENSSGESEIEPFQIRHLLGATAAVALALSAIRLGTPEDSPLAAPEDFPLVAPDFPSKEVFLVGFAMAALVVAAVSLFTTLPVVAATLRSRRALRTLLAILLVDIAAFLGILVILFREWLPGLECVYVAFAAMGVGFFVGITGVLLAVRALGYRLAWGRHNDTLGDGGSEVRRRVLLAALACGLPFFIVNSVLPPLACQVLPGGPGAPSVYLYIYMYFGVIGAEAALHSVWCVLAPVPFTKRLAIGVGVGLGWYVGWAAGYVASNFIRGGPDFYHFLVYDLIALLNEIVIVLLCLPLLAIAIQSPLWLARIWLGWRIEHRANPARGSHVEPFQIRHLLGAMAAVALALSAAQLIGSWALRDFAFVALEFAGVSLFTTLPVVAATLRGRCMLLALPAILVFDVLLGILVIHKLLWLSFFAYVAQAAMGLGFLVGLTGVLLVVRALGYRLAWGRRKTAADDRDPASSE